MSRGRSTPIAVLVAGTQAFGWTTGAQGAAPHEKASLSDFTQGGKKGDSHDWNLGPTGARGGPCVVRNGEARLRLETQAGRACAIAWSGGKIRQVE